jgi:hypothetical protein
MEYTFVVCCIYKEAGIPLCDANTAAKKFALLGSQALT